MSIIAVPTATRAEYGNLRPFIQELRDNGFEVRIIATGAHLSQAYGETYQEIEEDGFAIDYQIPILVDSDNACGVSKTMALAISGFADYFANRRPDGLLVLGDRYEMLAIACAAFNELIQSRLQTVRFKKILMSFWRHLKSFRISRSLRQKQMQMRADEESMRFLSNMPLSITISFFLTRLDQKGTCLHWPMLMRWSGTLRAA